MLLTVVMYHYVRELRASRFPEIKGLEYRLFAQQLEYLGRHYQFVGMDDVLDALDHHRPLPPRAVLLTFDDAYADHYRYAFPLMDRLGIPGAFYAPARAVADHELLDVNKIHFLLARVDDKALLVRSLFDLLDAARRNPQYAHLPPNAHLYTTLAVPNRFDTGEVIFIKRLLQRELPEALRTQMVDELWARHMDVSAPAFARELYMSVEELQLLHRHGHHVGGHGYNHQWLGHLSPAAQQAELDATVAFLTSLGVDPTRWTLAYPYGSYNDHTLTLLPQRGCRAAFTTQVATATVTDAERYLLPRFDTNDFPKDGHAAFVPVGQA